MKSTPKIDNYLSKHDLILKQIIESVSIDDVKSSNNVFNDLLSCIIEQQIHYRSTKNIFSKMLKKAELTELTIENFDKFEKNALIDSKISMKKIEAINDILIFFNTHTIDWNSLSDEEVKSKLSSIKGVGDWSVAMILLYTLKRNNIFPYSDYHLKNIMIDMYSIDSKIKRNMVDISSTWSPYASFATLYLLEFAKQKKLQ